MQKKVKFLFFKIFKNIFTNVFLNKKVTIPLLFLNIFTIIKHLRGCTHFVIKIADVDLIFIICTFYKITYKNMF